MWKPLFGRAAAIGLLLAGSLAACRSEKAEDPTSAPAGYAFTDVDVGLSAEETEIWRWTSEGSDLAPVDVLRALLDKNTGTPFIESLARYGFLPSPESPSNPYGLPAGWVTDVPELSLLNLPYVGVNCAACHTGQIEYRGQRLRIDGAPNLADIEAFGLAVRDSAVAMLKDPIATFRFVRRLARLRPPAATAESAESAAAGPAVPGDTLEFLEQQLPAAAAAPESAAAPTLARHLGESYARLLRGEATDLEAELERVAASARQDGLELEEGARLHVARSHGFVATYAALLRDRAGLGLRAIRAFEISPVAGPGRDDPWGIIRNLLFRRETPLTAPTSIPHLFHSLEFDWYHADGNTNSVMQRNIAQAVALGAYVDETTFQSTLRPRDIWELERVLAKIRSPAWPGAVFGPIDREQAARGEAIFERKETGAGGGRWSCAGCHRSREGTLFKLAAVGTDPNRARNFLRPLDGKPFDQQIPEAVSKIEAVAFEKAGITPEEAKEHEYASEPQWRGTGKYMARRLDGVWATAPYLHNASVPTLYDLLLPAAERPQRFPVGHREYDPEKVGYVTEGAEPVSVFDTTIDGNSNAGHEFGTGLSDAERWDLIEYLKTL